MPYASIQDVIDRLGQSAVDQMADDPFAGSKRFAALEQGLADASEEIDGYVGARHALPLDPVPGPLVRICVQIGVYLRCSSADLATDLQKDRAESARRFLRDVSKGAVSLGPADPDPPAAASEPGVQFESGAKVLDRDSLRSVL